VSCLHRRRNPCAPSLPRHEEPLHIINHIATNLVNHKLTGNLIHTKTT
jgi:hypothetical protein